MFAVKEEVISRASSEHGEEEMEVESGDEHKEEAKAQGAVLSRGRNMGASFHTLSSLTSLKPGTLLVLFKNVQWKNYFPGFRLCT